MEFRVLGNLEAEAGGKLLPLGGPSEQKVLAVLLLDGNRVVPVARLVDALWGDDPPGTATKQVRNAVSRLRRLLAAGEAPGAVETRGAGYRLAVADNALDARQFESNVARAGLVASAGQVAEAARLLRSALDLWRGPFLAGMDGQALEAVATAWDERRCATSETYYDHELALGRHREIVADLSVFAADHPLREKPVAQLMLALCRCGRQADALALYADTRRLLAEEIGLDPGPVLRELHQQILTADPALTVMALPGTEGHPYAPKTPQVVPRQLPGALRHFVGRREELKALTGLLGEVGGTGGTVIISAIEGTAGIGKTALAVLWAHQIAERFPDGQLFVNLRGFDPSGNPATPAEAIRRLLDALGVPSARIPADLEAQAGLYRSLLVGKRVLVVLDNARDAEHVRPLLPGSPGCLVIITSRSQLTGLVVAMGALALTLDPLADAEACELLARRLGSERIAAEPKAVDKLAGLCARLPLALSIAAARAVSRPTLPLAALVTELRDARDRLDSLCTGDDATDMRAVFSWSYANLSRQTARMFRLLGIHPGPDIALPAAASLAGVPVAQAREALDELSRAHLLVEHAQGRFAFHDLLRAYAAEQARSQDSDAACRAAMTRMLDHYLHTAHSAARLLQPDREPIDTTPLLPSVTPEILASQAQAWGWYEVEYQVLLAVIDSADGGFDAYAARIPWCVATYLDRRGQWHDLSATQHVALAAARRLGDDNGQASAHRTIGNSCVRVGSHEAARTHFQLALDLFQRLGNHLGAARTQQALAHLLGQQGRHHQALAHARQALDLYHALGRAAGQAHVMSSIGWYHAQLGEYEKAIAHCGQALDLHRQNGDRAGEAASSDSLGYAHHQLGHHDESLACYTHALELARDLGQRYHQAEILAHLGDTHQAAGNIATAQIEWRRALTILDDLQHSDAEGVRARLFQAEQSLNECATKSSR